MAFYDNISATIGEDEYFANVLDAVWDISGNASAPKHNNVWTDKSKQGEKLDNSYHYKNADPRDLKTPTLRSGLESSDNPWHTITPYYQVANADRRSVASQYKHRQGRDHMQITGEESKDHLLNQSVLDTYERHRQTHQKPLEVPRQAPTFTMMKDFELVQERFKTTIVQRGTRGLIGLKRQFKILDDSNDGSLEIQDFLKGLDDYKIEVSQSDLAMLYHAYNVPETSKISYIRLLDEIVGQLNQFRTAKVELAWRKIDTQNVQFLNWDFISQSFNASRHPGVKTGYITEEEVQHDFEETFKALHGVYHSFQPDQQVTKDEFFEYFRILSFTIPNDKVFDVIMTGVWNVDLRDIDPKSGGVRSNHDFQDSKGAWKYDFHRSIYGKMNNSPFEHPVVEKSSKPQRPKTAISQNMSAAGVFSAPFENRGNIQSNVAGLGSDNFLSKAGLTTNNFYGSHAPKTTQEMVFLHTANGKNDPLSHPQTPSAGVSAHFHQPHQTQHGKQHYSNQNQFTHHRYGNN